ncbi:MAG TPA: methionine--tRNA ligase, partial [Candidatus Eisenbacteria bacterium]
MPRRFYITTAIDYVNGRPHLGHAYEKVLADALARYHRQRGDATFFLTGTDEHGQKVARAADAAAKTPQAFVDELVPTFVEAWRRLGVSYDQFIRTTSQRHELAVRELFRRLWEARSPRSGKPVLYQDEYVGLYCEGCEAFKQEKDLDAKGRCPIHRRKPKEIRETNFFFRLSEYDEALIKHIEAHPEFIEPDYRRHEVLNVVREGLQDVSVSRPNIPWGVPLPPEIPDSEGHTAYVWPDALLNYLSAIGWPERRYAVWWLAREADTGGPGAARQDEFQELDGQGRPGAAWAGTGQPLVTNAFHLIGKDISRFHCVLWPALLLAAGVPLPRQVYVHGFINLGGERLSKSAGVVIDPVRLAEAVGPDALRFYLLHAIPTGRDGDFTVEQLVEHCNTHLANGIGNLTSRTLTLARKYCDGNEPAGWDPAALREPGAPEALVALTQAADALAREGPEGFEAIRVHEGLDAAARLAMRADEFVDRCKPWALGKDPERKLELETTLGAVLEVLRLLAIALWPAMPAKCEELWSALGLPGKASEQRGDATRPSFGPRATPRTLGAPGMLFPRIEGDAVRAAL